MTLRSLTEEDLLPVLSWRNAPEVRKHMYSSNEIGEKEHREWFKRIQDDKTVHWYIHEDAAGRADGVAYFTQHSSIKRSAFWGFYMSPEARPGMGTALGIDSLDLAFSKLNLHKLNSEVLASNGRSLRFHEKLGFQKEGLFRDFHFNGEHYVDVVRFGMLAREWSEMRLHVTSARTDSRAYD
ncbi:UDP-4-amino-4,6-dideoxy-N-acetyl-beta-L-altrosamine N-acetyltransferase [Herbaspirillum seropedicae]|uniref:UDP-4-amino-4, 6-dideoxy-N-acetyl-beta-L-altrosamine N-acetyltransferase n=1 Tax=Herbaspirillum seropedicae TaxID=964 RepID=UPI003F8D505E